MKIQAFIYDGFDELDLVGIYEPLRMAGLNIEIMTLAEQSVITSAHGLKLCPDGLLSLEKKPDVLIVPGGGWLNRAEQGAWQEAKNPDVLNLISAFHQEGVIIAAVCTGVLLLAKAGLLKGRPATTNHEAVDELQAAGAKLVSHRVVDDGDIVTAGGITSSIDLGLWLVEKFIGASIAAAISKRLEFERRGPVWKVANNN